MSQVYLSKLLPDPQDPRDFIFEVERDVILPTAVDLRAYTGQVEDQKATGSCSANATVSAAEMFLAAAGLFQDTPATDALDRSRRFNYYTSRELLGPEYLTGDPGSTERMALRAGNKHGIPAELICPYDESAMNVKPSDEAYADAANFRIGEYRRIKFESIDDSIFQIRYALASGYPVLLGLNIGRKLQNMAADDVYAFINPTLNPLWGGHEMVIVGYDTYKGLPVWIVKNSWGDDWCDGGYFKCLATVPAVDGIDVWVMCGFAGIERVGVDQVQPKPAPVPPPATDPLPPILPPVEPAPDPTPEPVPPTPQPDPLPVPEPVPEPPAPIPVPPAPDLVPPTPKPTPQPEEKSSGNGVLILVAVAAILAIAHFGGFIQ